MLSKNLKTINGELGPFRLSDYICLVPYVVSVSASGDRTSQNAWVEPRLSRPLIVAVIETSQAGDICGNTTYLVCRMGCMLHMIQDKFHIRGHIDACKCT